MKHWVFIAFILPLSLFFAGGGYSCADGRKGETLPRRFEDKYPILGDYNSKLGY